MWLFHAFALTLRPVVQGKAVVVERCWISTRRKPDEKSGEARFGRELRVGKKTRSKKKSLRPELNWGPTG